MNTTFETDFFGLSIGVRANEALSALPGLDYLETDEAVLARTLFGQMLAADPDAFGFLRTEGGLGQAVEGGRFAAMEENLGLIDRHFEARFANRSDGTMLINGIGGQTTCSEWFVGCRPMPKGREYLCLDSLGTRYLDPLLGRLVQLLSHTGAGKAVRAIDEIDYPLFWVASSKSGGTDETMANFQSTFTLLLRALSRVLDRPRAFEDRLVEAIFSLREPRPVWMPDWEAVAMRMGGGRDAETARAILRRVLETMIFTTDHNPGPYNGWASRLTAFRRGPLVRELLAGGDILSMHIPRDLGGRYNGIGANALVVARFLGLDIRAIARAALETVPALRRDAFPGNPLLPVGAWLSLAGRTLANGNKALVLFNTPELAKSAEALVQLFPETVGKGKGLAGDPLFGLFPVARQNTPVLGDMNGKIVFLLEAAAPAAPLRFDGRADLVVRVGLPDAGPESVARLIMAMEYWAMMTSVFNEASWLLPRLGPAGAKDADAVRRAAGGDPQKPWKHTPEHTALSGALQGGVQLAKKLAQQAGIRLFNSAGDMSAALDGVMLPQRNRGEREAWYRGRENAAGFVAAEMNVPGWDQKAAACRNLGKPLADARDEETAVGLAALKLCAREQGRLLDCWVYAPRGEALSAVKHRAEAVFADLLDPAPQTQHQRAQQKVEGADATVTVIVDVGKRLQTVVGTEDVLVYDGCVPAYLSGLYPSEVGALYAQQYSLLLHGMEGRFSARLQINDIEQPGELERLLAVFGRAAEIALKVERRG